MAQHNIPKLRFPEFSGEWEEKKLGEIADVSKLAGYEFTKHITYEDAGSIIALRGLNIKNNNLDLKDVKYIDNSELHKLSRSKLYVNDIMFTYIGTIGEVALIKEDNKFYLAPNVSRIRVTANNVLPLYVNQYFTSDRFKDNEIKQYISSSSQPALTMENVRKFKIAFPSLPEQQKIASFLSAIDKKIEQLQKKKELLEQYKKGMMQKLFSREIRFRNDNDKDFPEWEEVQLKDIFFEHKTKNVKETITEVFSVAKHKGVINQIEHLGRSYAAENTSNYKVVYPNDVIYTKSPTSDYPFGIIKQNKTGRKGIVSTLYGVFTPKNKYIGLIMDVYFSSWQNTYNYLNPLVQKGAKNTMNINNDDFLNGATLYVPASEDEQVKIANVILQFDNKIALTDKELAGAKTFKKGLLQQMFV